MAAAQSTDATIEEGTITESLRKQLREEIYGSELKNPERFMLEQKFGLVDPVLTDEEKQLIAAEEVRLERIAA